MHYSFCQIVTLVGCSICKSSGNCFQFWQFNFWRRFCFLCFSNPPLVNVHILLNSIAWVFGNYDSVVISLYVSRFLERFFVYKNWRELCFKSFWLIAALIFSAGYYSALIFYNPRIGLYWCSVFFYFWKMFSHLFSWLWAFKTG